MTTIPRAIYTMRVDEIANYQERRDSADQKIPELLHTLGFLPFPLPNRPQETVAFLKAIQPRAIVLTGGNDLVSYGGLAPERDLTERQAIEWALQVHIPVLGICRGFQMLLSFFGVRLIRVQGHVAQRHAIHGLWERSSVNSYHSWAAFEAPKKWEILARAEDNVLEAARCKEKKVLGLAWHPEREKPFDQEDLQLLYAFLHEKA